MSSTPPKTQASVQAAPAPGVPVAQPGYPQPVPQPVPQPIPQQPVYPVVPGQPVAPQQPVLPVNDPRYPQTEPRDPSPVAPITPRTPENEPPVVTTPPQYPPITPNNDQTPIVPPPTPVEPVTPVFQPPSVQPSPPPPTVATEVPVPGTDPVAPVPPTYVPTPAPIPTNVVPPTGNPALPYPTNVPPTQGSPYITPMGTPVPNAPMPPSRPPGIGANVPSASPTSTAQTPNAKFISNTQPPARPADLQLAEPPAPTPKAVRAPVPPARPKDLQLAPPEDPGAPVQSVEGTCGPVKLQAASNDPKLDVLFVVDTSASLQGGKVGSKKGELEQIASQMEAFVNNFPENTDINIGVLLGHGHGNWVGRLYKSSPGEAAVLKTKEIRNRADLIRRLETKMKTVPNESGGAQGEALLYSLYEAAARSEKRSEIQNQGMFRKDAKLAVIMVTDEQDVCFDYDDAKNFDPETGRAYVANGKKDAKGKAVRDPVEVKFFNDVCKTAIKLPNKKTEQLRPANVHAAVSTVVGGSENLILMGMVYTSKVIKTLGVVTNAKEDENEMGHGIIEFVGAERGKLVDLAQVQEGPAKFRAELNFLGDYTNAELNSNGNIACDPMSAGKPAIHHPMSVNLSTLKLHLQNNEGETIGVFSADCEGAKCAPGHGGLSADIRNVGGRRVVQAFMEAKALNALLNAHKLKESKVLFKYSTRTDFDSKTGEAVDPATGKPTGKASPASSSGLTRKGGAAKKAR